MKSLPIAGRGGNAATYGRRLCITLSAFLALLFTGGLAAEQKVFLDAWNTSGLGDWSEKSFAGNTQYQVKADGESSYLSATAEHSASALFLKRKITIEQTPFLNWRWRAKRFNGAKDHFRKSEDDFPARIYVVVREGFLPWQTLAINYVWAEGETGQTSWPNPFTEKAIMVPIVQGENGAGEWRQEKVNIVADFKRLFDKDISAIDGLAIMTDADNHGGVSAADYGSIWLSSQ